MARVLSQTLVRECQALIRDQPPPFHLRLLPPSSRLVNLRSRSGRSEKLAQVFELELDPEGAAPHEAAAAATRRLEDVIHGIVVRRAAPDWLPFIPGSSYWVPPRVGSRGLLELLGRMSTPMKEEEVMSLTTVRGWPCSAHLVKDQWVLGKWVKYMHACKKIKTHRIRDTCGRWGASVICGNVDRRCISRFS